MFESKVLLFICASFLSGFALECGINVNGTDDQFKELTQLCTVGNKSVVTDKPKGQSSEDEDEEDDYGYSEKESIGRNTTQILEDDNTITTTVSPNHSNQTGVKQQCVVQCVFERLDLTDSNGYPEHHKILEALLKNAEGRELRDFLQDSTDECFKLMKQAETLDSCTYSSLLVTCLADKGRTNCGDWPVGNLPFHQG